MTTNDKNTQRFIVKLGSEHFCTSSVPYTCVQKGEVICLRFFSVHLPPHPPPEHPVPIFRLPPVATKIRQTKFNSNTFKQNSNFYTTRLLFFFYLWEQRDIFRREKNSNFEIRGAHLSLEQIVWCYKSLGNRCWARVSPVRVAGRAQTVRKTYFSDNDNEKGKYSDENSPIRGGCSRVEDIKGRRVLLNDIFRHALLLLLTHGSDNGYPIVVYQTNTYFKKYIRN